MATVFDRFKKSIVGSEDKIYDYIPVIDASGDFKKVTGIEALSYSWNVILQTPTGIADHDPTFGCDLFKMVFEPADPLTEEQIEYSVRNQLLAYDPRAEIIQISVSFAQPQGAFVVNVVLRYKGQDRSLSVLVDENSIPNRG